MIIQTQSIYVGENIAGWNLHTGSGDRAFDQQIMFTTPFQATPLVIVSMSRLDADKGFNTRVIVEAKNVTNVGFVLRTRAWADTKLYSVGVSWLAHGN